MAVLDFIETIPSYANDIAENLKVIFGSPQEGLSDKQVYAIALTVACYLKNEKLVNDLKKESRLLVEDSEFVAIKAAIAIMLQNNCYFKFAQGCENEEVKKLPSDMFMAITSNPPVESLNFEMYMLVASILGGCEHCCNVHTRKLTKKGVEPITIRNIARITAVVKAAAEILEIERIRSYDFMVRGESL
jgi:alkyl hydroperoxide reductase subunit D